MTSTETLTDLEAIRHDSIGFKDILARNHLVDVRGAGPWVVDSESGSTYQVSRRSYISHYEGSLGFHWKCTCPAQRGCRHITAVQDVEYAEALAEAQDGDSDRLEILERSD